MPKVLYKLSVEFSTCINNCRASSDNQWVFHICLSSLRFQVNPNQVNTVEYLFLKGINIKLLICRNRNEFRNFLLKLLQVIKINQIHLIQKNHHRNIRLIVFNDINELVHCHIISKQYVCIVNTILIYNGPNCLFIQMR